MKHIRVTTQNLDWGLNDAKWSDIIDKLQAVSDVILFQEAKNVDLRLYASETWGVFQNHENEGTRGTAIMWRKSLGSVHNTGLDEFVPSVKGVKMPDRYIAYINLWVRDWNKHVVFASAHFPPLRFRERWPVAIKNYVKFVKHFRRFKLAFVIGSDFNQKVTNDVHGIKARLGLLIRGERIDGFGVSRRLKASRVKNLGNDASDHDPLQILVSPRARRQILPSRN